MRFVRGHSGIFVPITRDTIIDKPFQSRVSGHITVELIDARTKKVKRRLQFNNLITDAGLNGMATTGIVNSSNGLIRYCAVGTGTTAPTTADTTLESELGSASRVTYIQSGDNAVAYSYVSGSPDYYKAVIQYLFTESQANGNLTEIGFFTASSTGTMFSRQLFKDELGDPTEVTKTSDDQLRIIYEVRCYPPVDDVVASDQDISGTDYDVTCRAQAVGSIRWNIFFTTGYNIFNGGGSNHFYSSALLSRTSTDFGTATGSGTPSSSAATYVSGNFYRDVTVVAAPSMGNMNILSYAFSGNAQIIFALGFSDTIAKDDTKRFTLNFRCSWGRYSA